MSGTIGVVCKKDGFGFTIINGDGVRDHDLTVPSSFPTRGAQLDWLLEEAERVFEIHKPENVCIQRATGGKLVAPSPERIEVESLLQVAAHRFGSNTKTMSKDQVRAALGEPKTKGAYDELLKRPEVAARSNSQRRDQFLLALAAQK
jgi:hypothetical protein